MNHFRHIIITAATLATAALTLAAMPVPAAFAERVPPPGEGDTSVFPVHTVTSGGMPGWQIALIALAAALAAAILAVLLDHAWMAHKAHSAAAVPSPTDHAADEATKPATESQRTSHVR